MAEAGATRRRTAWRVLLVAIALAGLWLALTPRPPQSVDTGWDKSNHGLAFAVLAIVGWQAVAAGARARLLAALLAYGGLIELLQAFTPTRTAEWADLLADAIGLALGALAAGAVERWQARRRAALSPPSSS